MPTPESSEIVENLERNSQNFEIYQNLSKKLKLFRTCSSKPGSKESMVLNEEAVIRKNILNLEQEIQKLHHKTQLVKYENVLLENQKLKSELGYQTKQINVFSGPSNIDLFQDIVTSDFTDAEHFAQHSS